MCRLISWNSTNWEVPIAVPTGNDYQTLSHSAQNHRDWPQARCGSLFKVLAIQRHRDISVIEGKTSTTSNKWENDEATQKRRQHWNRQYLLWFTVKGNATIRIVSVQLLNQTLWLYPTNCECSISAVHRKEKQSSTFAYSQRQIAIAFRKYRWK